VDEQHRFGVMQRLKLMKKSDDRGETGVSPVQPGGDARPSTDSKSTDPEPDVLVMTATPIPRTLALTLYGDLDVSVLDELPPGRTPVVTRSLPDERAPEVWDFVRKQIAAGHQAYVVYPVIEENPAKTEEREVKAAEQMHRQLREKTFPTCMSACCMAVSMPTKKKRVMREFQQARSKFWSATTVIEVGRATSPNATVMVISTPTALVWRSSTSCADASAAARRESYCVLMARWKSFEEGERRLDAMVRSNDGSRSPNSISQLRGPGEFFGTKTGRHSGASAVGQHHPRSPTAGSRQTRKLPRDLRPESRNIKSRDRSRG